MRTPIRIAVAMAIACAPFLSTVAAAQSRPLVLDRGWQMQSSAKVPASGDKISTRAYVADKWYPVSVPTTVLGGLVANQVYKDPGFGMNLRAIPGTSYAIGRNFANLPMPDDSPFRVSWWFRTQFDAPSRDKDGRVALRLDGLNYRANIWMNGRRIADSTTVTGMFRVFEFDVTSQLTASGPNVLAIEILPPQADDLAWTWVDWSPAPPDKNMGLWRPVSLTTSGAVTVRHTSVKADVDPSLTRASLTVISDLTNLTDRPVEATVRATIGSAAISQKVSLGARERKTVRFLPTAYAPLRVTNPKLWWPVDMGEPNVSDAVVAADVAGRVSDQQKVTYGIRSITPELTDTGARLFRINGRKLLIRGGGWAPDMLLRTDAVRQEAELAYVRDMHLNTVRLEGKLEDEHFFDLADRMGILVMAGWSCCDQWEQWSKWTPENHVVAEASQRDQIARLRSHPSLLVWLDGSDNPPPADVEKKYTDILTELDWPNPSLSSATGRATTVTGPSGVKMTGPYDWVPPVYWYEDKTRGGAFGFNTETSPGPAVPPVESLKKMLPADHLWPIDDVWNFHAGGGRFANIKIYSDALAARYGASNSIDDFAMKSQLAAYEGERAMFEAFTARKYTATGVIQWMLNNAWPSMIWHLYDAYLRPGGGYFGAKKANEPTHVQYSYDDHSIVVVTNGPRLVAVTVHARVFNLDGSAGFARDMTIDVPADGVGKSFSIPENAAKTAAYILELRVTDDSDNVLTSNAYWLSSKPDVLDHARGTGTMTPTTASADFSGLMSMRPATVTNALRIERRGSDDLAHVTLTNKSPQVAFSLRLSITKGVKGDEVLPVLWQDNYVTLAPGETREITATYAHQRLDGASPTLYVRGVNVK